MTKQLNLRKLPNRENSFFQKDGEEEDNAGEGEETESSLPNLLELSYLFEQAGVGLGREETYRIWLSLKQLVDKYLLESVRFWGKIFGIEQNYYVAEVKIKIYLQNKIEFSTDNIMKLG